MNSSAAVIHEMNRVKKIRFLWLLGEAGRILRTRYCTAHPDPTHQQPTMAPPTAHGLSEDEVADLKEAFSMFDTDGGGTCSPSVRDDAVLCDT